MIVIEAEADPARPPTAIVYVVVTVGDTVIVPLKFCCENENNMLDGVAELSVESSNANTCESTLATNVLALLPFKPSLPSAPSSPCLATAIDIVFAKLTDDDAAVMVTEPLCGVVVAVIVTEFDDEVAVICDGVDTVYV